MLVSTFELFKLGVGPSSSHTMGPMSAAADFVEELLSMAVLSNVTRVEVTLYSSLALTGRGHATDTAVMLGLAGYRPATMEPDAGIAALDRIRLSQQLPLGGQHLIGFNEHQDILWAKLERLEQHPNALRFSARNTAEHELHSQVYFSVGGGFIVTAKQYANGPLEPKKIPPFPFTSAAELLEKADVAGLSIAQLMAANEATWQPPASVVQGLDLIADSMHRCIDRGLRMEGVLPGGLRIRRRAKHLFETSSAKFAAGVADPLAALDWINFWAMAVNEENAAGGRVVTAPTNGAAGIIPAVLRYHRHFHGGTDEDARTFLLTAAAIGSLYKRNASISGAEVGCQGEVGVACSMAAAGLAAVLGGTNAQIENAAEIGMEHNLGLTCDPIGGLVQIPCIERNAIGAVKAVDAARLALLGDGQHTVCLDKVVETMKRTGADMNEIYKETSLGGLAVSVQLATNCVEC
ncbi:TPA: L-serine ammonia-lyase [Pseudomonas aeruginosa]